LESPQDFSTKGMFFVNFLYINIFNRRKCYHQKPEKLSSNYKYNYFPDLLGLPLASQQGWLISIATVAHLDFPPVFNDGGNPNET